MTTVVQVLRVPCLQGTNAAVRSQSGPRDIQAAVDRFNALFQSENPKGGAKPKLEKPKGDAKHRKIL